MAATLKELQELHKLLAKSLTKRIVQDMEDEIPTDAATLGAAITFLKNNSVTADPKDAEDLDDLRKKMIEQASQRKSKVGSALSQAAQDIMQ